jgi:DDE superfamily endonuclease/Helix-turn-helix of DDE superfamily endonuclease
MKDPFQYIQKYPDRTKQLLGIDNQQFQALLSQAELRHGERQKALESEKVYINTKGGGRQSILSIQEEICLCIYYLRQFPTFEVLGLQFGVSKTVANDRFHYWLNILEDLLPSSLLEQLKNQQNEDKMIEEMLTEFRLIVDSFEQPRERPEENQAQQEVFSGKKKMHTFKNQMIVLPEGKDIVDIMIGKKGPTSDIGMFREQQSQFSSEQLFDGDKAYIGATNMSTPHKKPKNGELTAAQKAENKEFSSNRIFVEHVIRIVKIFRVAKERFRLHPNIYERIISVVCGLVRLRIGTLNFTV